MKHYLELDYDERWILHYISADSNGVKINWNGSVRANDGNTGEDYDKFNFILDAHFDNFCQDTVNSLTVDNYNANLKNLIDAGNNFIPAEIFNLYGSINYKLTY